MSSKNSNNKDKKREEEETEENVVIEFEGNFNLDDIEEKDLQLFGIDTDEPVLKVDSRYYKIDVKDSIGTRLVFNQEKNGKLSYFTKTDKCVTARRVFPKAKQKDGEEKQS